MADLIAENYYDRFAQYARKSGLGTHPEAGGPHGAPIDALENFRGTTYPQTEFWVVSGTHRATDDERFFGERSFERRAHLFPASPSPAAEETYEQWASSCVVRRSLGDGIAAHSDFRRAFTEGLNRLYSGTSSRRRPQNTVLRARSISQERT